MRWLRPCPLYTPPVATTDWIAQWGLRTSLGRLATTTLSRKVRQTQSFRGSKSRNKVSVGEPAEGSLISVVFHCYKGDFGPSSPSLSFCVPKFLWQASLPSTIYNSFNFTSASENFNNYNFQQRISWFWHQWRTQRNAISSVNYRIQWIIESLNAHCAPWYSIGHACSSVICTLKPCLVLGVCPILCDGTRLKIIGSQCFSIEAQHILQFKLKHPRP
jgi:hypothetical protein